MSVLLVAIGAHLRKIKYLPVSNRRNGATAHQRLSRRTVKPSSLKLADYVVLAAAVAAGLYLGFALGRPAHGHEHNSTPFAEWFNSRTAPDSGVGCCGEADQFYVRSYAASDLKDIAFHAVVDDKAGGSFEIDIPARKVDWTSVNPTGRGVIFIAYGEWGGPAVICFIPGTGV